MAKLNITNKFVGPVTLKDINDGDIFYYPSNYKNLKGYYIKTNRYVSAYDDHNKFKGYFIGCVRLSDGVYMTIDENEAIFNDFKVSFDIDYDIM